MPTYVEHAKKFDDKNGNQAWQYDIDKDMKHVYVAFNIIDHGKPTPVR